MKEMKDKRYRTNTQNARIEFFRGLLEKSNKQTDLFKGISPESGYYATISKTTGIPGTRFTYYKPKDEGNIEILFERKNKKENEEIFNYLFSKKEQIESDFGSELEWEPSLGNRRTAIRKRFSGASLSSPETWPKIQEKMVDAMVRFEKVLRPYLFEIRIKLNL
jgi:hypothetical protein